MPRSGKKKVEETKKTVTPVEEKTPVTETVTPVAEETPAEKKTTKKQPAKKPVTRKTTPKKVAEPAVDFFVEFNGVQESYGNIVENVKKSYLAQNEDAVITDIKIYLKPQDSKAYCVINGDINHEIDVYFV